MWPLQLHAPELPLQVGRGHSTTGEQLCDMGKSSLGALTEFALQPAPLGVAGLHDPPHAIRLPPVSWLGEATYGCAWRLLLPQPERRLGRLHGLLDHREQLAS